MAYKNKSKNKKHIKGLQANPKGWRIANDIKTQERRQIERANSFGMSLKEYEDIRSKFRL